MDEEHQDIGKPFSSGSRHALVNKNKCEVGSQGRARVRAGDKSHRRNADLDG